MKRFAKYAGVTATALALTLFAAAEDAPRTSTANSDQLVAVNAQLQRGLNAQTAKQGDTVTAKLLQTAHLNGTTLPRNTVLIGHIDEARPSQNNGVSKIVLTFDKAKLADGHEVAIKATIVGVYPEGTQLVIPNLNPELQVDQEPDSAHGFGLTSRVAGANSGTLSANGKNFHLSSGTELQFAMAPSDASTASTGN